MACGKERRSWRLAALPVVLGALAVGIAAGGSPRAVTVTHIADGDTLTVSSGADVRLVQIDTPELGSGECFSRAAAKELRRLAPVGSAVTLEADARLDGKDRYVGACIPSPPPDLDCKDISTKGFRVVGADPHRLDGDHDGLGCE